jgi:hypothetical protein
VLAGGLASISAACNHYDGWATCPDPTRIQRDYRVVAKTFDAGLYFPPGLYSSVPFWKPFESGVPTTQRDPAENSLDGTALFLEGLGEESLYARRGEPDLHVYRALTAQKKRRWQHRISWPTDPTSVSSKACAEASTTRSGGNAMIRPVRHQVIRFWPALP